MCSYRLLLPPSSLRSPDKHVVPQKRQNQVAVGTDRKQSIEGIPGIRLVAGLVVLVHPRCPATRSTCHAEQPGGYARALPVAAGSSAESRPSVKESLRQNPLNHIVVAIGGAERLTQRGSGPSTRVDECSVWYLHNHKINHSYLIRSTHVTKSISLPLILCLFDGMHSKFRLKWPLFKCYFSIEKEAISIEIRSIGRSNYSTRTASPGLH